MWGMASEEGGSCEPLQSKQQPPPWSLYPQGRGITSGTLQAAQDACKGYQDPGGHWLRPESVESEPLLSAQPWSDDS